MADVRHSTSGDEEIIFEEHDEPCNIDKYAAAQSRKESYTTLSSQHIRIVLFREGRLKECQLLFDSSLLQESNNEGTTTSTSWGHCKDAVNEENVHLTEMIFGSTAMRYNDTYFKIHDITSPRCIIFTEVFSMPCRTNMKQQSSTFNNSNLFSGNSSNSFGWEKVNNSKSLFLDASPLHGTRSQLALYNTNSTNSTLDSGFGEGQSFVSQSTNLSLSSQQGAASSSRLASSSSMSLHDSFFGKSDPRSMKYTRLGLALIIAYTAETNMYKDFLIENISFIRSLLNRLRKYVDIALGTPDFFIAIMLEISNDSSHWLTKLAKNLTIREHENESRSENDQRSTSSISFGLSKIGETLKEKWRCWRFFSKRDIVEYGMFQYLLTAVEVKERNFFLSRLLTAVLTYHLGWMETCFKLQNKSPCVIPRSAYNILWYQLMDLCVTFGRVDTNSRIVICGNNDRLVDDISSFIRYFMRCNSVEKRTIERGDVQGENMRVNMICDTFYQSGTKNTDKKMKRNKTFSINLSDVNDHETEMDFNKPSHDENNVMFILGDDDRLVDLKKTDLSTKIYKSNSSERMSETLTRTKRSLGSLSELIDENQQAARSDGSTTLVEIPEENEKSFCFKMRVLTFPLPSIKTAQFSTKFPMPLTMRKTALDEYVPDVIVQGTVMPAEVWKQKLLNDLSGQSNSYEGESVAIVGDLDNWTVEIMSNKRSSMKQDAATSDTVDTSELIYSMLEVLLRMGSSGTPKQYCMTHIEQRLMEICMRSNAMAKLLLNTDFCSIDILMSALDIRDVDVPLLMSVVSHLEPAVAQKYGLSYQ